MLWFVGMGVSGAGSLSRDALDVLYGADIVYLERFTSPVGDRDVDELARLVRGELRTADRRQVEDGGQILREARARTVVLLSYGDPYVATTHAELRTRAARGGTETRSVHAASALTSAVGECGLQHYKVGRTATIMADPRAATTPYYTIYRNVVQSSHTVLPLEYDRDGGFFLDPRAAMGLLEGAESGQRRRVFGDSTFVIIASRIGSGTQEMTAGTVASLRDMDFGGPPHTMIVPGQMHFAESDAVRALCRCVDEPSDNTAGTQSISSQMVGRYVPMVEEMIRDVEPRCTGPGSARILENARAYARDAEDFLSRGYDEVAVLSIGYADGLVDSLRISMGLERND